MAITVFISHNLGSSNSEPACSIPIYPSREYTMEPAVESRKTRRSRQPFLQIRSRFFCIFLCGDGLICRYRNSKIKAGHIILGIPICLFRDQALARKKIIHASGIYAIICTSPQSEKNICSGAVSG